MCSVGAYGAFILTKAPFAGCQHRYFLTSRQLAVSNKNSEHRGTTRTRRMQTKTSDRGNILMFDKGGGLDLRNEPQRGAPSQMIEAERMSVIGRMACSIFHDMRHSLSAIYANAEFLERRDICPSVRVDLLLEIREAVLAMTESIDSLVQFGSSGRNNLHVHERVSLVVEKAVAAVKFHPDGRNVSITVGKVTPVEADIDARNLESAIHNLLLNPAKLRPAQLGCLR
jgi:signal transduction histidine kinase